jgi:hypothetical protein
LGQIDSGLKKDGKTGDATPAAPEEGEIIKDMAATQARLAKANANPEPTQSAEGNGLLGAIDQKLQSKGVETTNIQTAPAASNNTEPPARKSQPKQQVELQPKVSVESGPLYLSPAEVPAQDKAASGEGKGEQEKQAADDKSQDPGTREIPKALIKGPSQPPAPVAVAKSGEKKDTPTFGDEEDKGVFDRLKQDAESLSKLLNPFSW